MIPINRIIINENDVILKWVKVNKVLIPKTTVPIEGISFVRAENDHTLFIHVYDGNHVIVPEIKDAEKVSEALDEVLPESKNIGRYVDENDISKIDNFHANFYCHFLFLYLLKLVRFVELPDDVFDLYLFLKFFNDFSSGKVQFFIIFHYQYIERLRNFMNNLNLGWIPTYIDNILKVQPQFDENYMDNLKQIFSDEKAFRDFNNTIVENASLVIKADQEGDMLICREVERYTRENDLISKIQAIKLDDENDNDNQ